LKKSWLNINIVSFLSQEIKQINIDSKSLIVYTATIESEEYAKECCDRFVLNLFSELSELVRLYVELNNSNCSMLRIESFISKNFALDKFNISSIAIHDLRLILKNRNSMNEKSLINYCFPNYRGPKNKQTIYLKESKRLKRLRNSLYPSTMFQEILQKIAIK